MEKVNVLVLVFLIKSAFKKINFTQKLENEIIKLHKVG